MHVFLSYSSSDASLVRSVYDALELQSAWIDAAEIEWGDRFLERITDAIKNASDFVLFWSAHSAKSEWVKLELHMAFIQALERKAIRLRIVRLDKTGLPLYLEPYQYLNVAESSNQIGDIALKLREALIQPTQGVRHRFLNRNSELERIEDLVNDSETKVILLQGFQGIGKAALAKETLRRFFEGASLVEIAVGAGMGPAELALQLHHSAFRAVLPEVSGIHALAAIEKAISAIVNSGQFIVFRDTQHWLDNEGNPQEPLPTVIRQAIALPQTSYNPIILTSTRRPRIPVDVSNNLSVVRVEGLSDSHIASLIALWLDLSEGVRPDTGSVARVAPELHGHPIAAKLAATLIAQYGVDHLLNYPRELVALRRDLAKTLMRDIALSQPTIALAETVAIIGVPVPSRILMDALKTNEATFLDSIADATRTGIVETTDSGNLTVHPLVADYFWRSHLHRSDYQKKAWAVAQAVHSYLNELPRESASFVMLLPAVFRLYALSGDLDRAHSLRRGLVGELSQAAVTHYNRRHYDMAESFISHVLDQDPMNWRMRLYLARIRVRQRRWGEADSLINTLLIERPYDSGIRHLRGWRLLRAGEFEESLQVLSYIIAERNHVASIRDAAECLYRLNRIPEALDFLARAKQIENDNPYTLELEARIYEETGDFERALLAARVTVIRDPFNWSGHHRLARILDTLGRVPEALHEAREAFQLDPAQFVALSTLISLLLDNGQPDEAQNLHDGMKNLAIDETQRNISIHLSARILLQSGDIDQALEVVQKQITRRKNLAASFGLLAQMRLTQYSLQSDKSLASAQLLLQQATNAIAGCEAQSNHDERIVEAFKARIAELKPRTS